MRESGDGRKAMFPWCDAQTAATYAVGDAVRNNYRPPSCGTVVSVDAAEATMGVKWDDGSSPITYPMDASYLRKKMPWE